MASPLSRLGAVRDPDRGTLPLAAGLVAARGTSVTASHVRMVLGRDRVQGRESFGRSSRNPPVSGSQWGYTQRICTKTLSHEPAVPGPAQPAAPGKAERPGFPRAVGVMR